MVQNFARVAVAVVALNAAASLAQYQFDNAELEARETAPYVRRHFTRAELAQRDFEETSDLQARGLFPKFSRPNWTKLGHKKQHTNAGAALATAGATGATPAAPAAAKAANADPPAGASAAAADPSSAASPPDAGSSAAGSPQAATPQRRDLGYDYQLDARDLEETSVLEARAPLLDGIAHAFGDWKKGRKLRHEENKMGKDMMKAKMAGTGQSGMQGAGAGAGADDTQAAAPMRRRELENDYQLDTRDLDYELDDLE